MEVFRVKDSRFPSRVSMFQWLVRGHQPCAEKRDALLAWQKETASLKMRGTFRAEVLIHVDVRLGELAEPL